MNKPINRQYITSNSFFHDLIELERINAILDGGIFRKKFAA